MIEVFAGPTPNGRIPLVALHEMGLPYDLKRVALFEGAHYEPEFLTLNPSAQIPVIIDHDPALAEPIVLSQTTAILLHLSERSGKILPSQPNSRERVLDRRPRSVSVGGADE